MRLSNRNSIHSLMLVLSLCADCLMALPATAMAYPPSNNTVYSVRSFPATTTTRRDLTRESISTDVQSDSDWGGIENLIVPQTKSQAEKDAELKAQQEEETRKQAQAQAERQAQAQAIQQEEASRSAERTVITPPSIQNRTGRGRICDAVQRIPIRVRRQPAIRLGLFRIRPIRVRAIRCQSPPPVRQSNERRFARGIIGGSPTG